MTTRRAGARRGLGAVNKCEICGAKPGDECVNTLHPGEPLPGRTEHIARVTNVTADEKESRGNDACY